MPLVGKCFCGKETTRTFCVSFSPKTFEEKGPLPLSYWVCEDHTIDEAIAAAVEKKEQDGHNRRSRDGVCRHCGK